MFIFRSWKLQETPAPKLRAYTLFLSLITVILAMISIEWFDHSITFIFREDDWKWLFAREVTHIGLFSNYFLAALFFLAVSLYLIRFKKVAHPKIYTLFIRSRVMIFALLFSGLWVQILKAIFGRQRPKISPDFDPHAFYPFNTHWDFHSMPSGHTQVLFTVASFFAFYYPGKKYYIYLLAFIFSFTRVMTRDHFFGDVMGGALVGHLTTIWLFYYLNKKKLLA